MTMLERKRLERPVVISAGGVRLSGDVAIPDGARGLVLFAHGSGSSRFSPRNRMVAAELRRSGVGTLLFDLLTDREAGDRRRVFDIPLLAERLRHATTWVLAEPELRSLPVGYFGASTGAAAALAAAAEPQAPVSAIVSRGGRPDLAADSLPRVHAPTLLIVGGHDELVLDLNRRALELLACTKRLEVVPRATHLFGEPGALERVAQVAAEWFSRYLRSRAAREA